MNLPIVFDFDEPWQGTWVVVRIHSGTTEAQLRRHVGWASSLGGLWLLSDETFGRPALAASEEVAAAGRGAVGVGAEVFGYNEQQMLEAFPVLEELRKALPDRPDAIRPQVFGLSGWS